MVKKLTRIRRLENTVIILRDLISNMNVALENHAQRISTLEIDMVPVLRKAPRPKYTHHRRIVVDKINKSKV